MRTALTIVTCLAALAPAACNSSNKNNTAALCGNGKLDPKESCDPKIPAGQKGACPTSCDDGNVATVDVIVGTAAACDAVCVHVPVPVCGAADGVCPPCCSATADVDCQPVCGNGLVEAGETCDGNCPTSCNDGNACTTDTLTGDPASCTAACTFVPITSCKNGDGCCPPGCTASNDSDCATLCGNGVVDAGETCDGNCPTSCDDGDPCTTDTLTGSAATCTAACVHTPISACVGGDGCCPSGCNSSTDTDCTSSNTGSIGDACSANNECQSGLCFDQASTGFPGGYCTKTCGVLTCDAGSTCNAPGLNAQPGACLQSCDPILSPSTCRAGYHCFDLGNGTGACAPNTGCATNNDCPAWVPVCDTTTATCGGCKTDNDCNAFPSLPVCDTQNGVCTAGAANGAACTLATDCATTVCMTETMGAPGGECIQSCTTDNDCTEGGICVAPGLCVQPCTALGATCSRAGYTCQDAAVTPMGASVLTCAPAMPSCNGASDCPSWAAACGSGGSCGPCQSDADCVRFSGLGVCNLDTGLCVNPQPNGSSCASAGDCASGSCITTAAFSNGYCTQTCSSDADCSWGGHCAADPTGQIGCATTCDPSVTYGCRPGYACIDIDGDQVYECMPAT